MLRTMLRDLLAHRARLAMTLFAIALGVAATVGSWVVTDSIAATLAAREIRHDVGVSVQSPGKEPVLAPADRDRLAAVPGVARAEGVIVGRAGIVGRDGKLVQTGTVLDRAATNWSGDERFELVAGSPPAGPGQVALNASDARTAGLAVGDTARILLAEGKVDEATVTALFGYRQLGPESIVDSNGPSDAVPVVAYESATAAGLLGDRFHRIELTGADPGAIADAVRALVPDDHHVTTGRALAGALAEQSASDVQDLRMTMLPFAAVVLLVGMFVIANTFAVLVTQRTRQFALLRAVGARKRQVRVGIAAEAAALGVAGGTIGTLAGVAIAPLLLSALRPDDEVAFTVTPYAVLLGYAVAVLVTVLAANGSARRAAAVPPVAALRMDAVVPRGVKRSRNFLGLGCLLIAAGLIAATADPSSSNAARIIALVGAVVGVIGVIVLAPQLAELVLRPLARTFARSGPAVRLGLRNAAGDPRRTAGTATAITIGLALVCSFATISSTFAALIASTTRANLPDRTTVLQSAAGGESALTPAELRKAIGLPGVTEVAGSRDVLIELAYPGGETVRRISAIEPAALGTVLTPKLTAGSADLSRGVVVSQNQADMLGLRMNDEVTLELDAKTSVTQRVVGVYDATELGASLFLDVGLAPESLRKQVTTVYASGPDPAAARQSIENAFRDRPDVTIGDRESMVQDGVDQQAFAFALMYAMFGVAIVIALFGVVNTLMLSVAERTREIGVFRAVGATRLLVRRTIRVESTVVSIFGALLGVLVGVPVGAVMQHAMFGQRLGDFTMPTEVIAASLVAIAICAVLAAMWPARRAARTDVLKAIAAE